MQAGAAGSLRLLHTAYQSGPRSSAFAIYDSLCRLRAFLGFRAHLPPVTPVGARDELSSSSSSWLSPLFVVRFCIIILLNWCIFSSSKIPLLRDSRLSYPSIFVQNFQNQNQSSSFTSARLGWENLKQSAARIGTYIHPTPRTRHGYFFSNHKCSRTKFETL